MTIISEIAPDLYRISVYVPVLDLQFNHFLVRDRAPLLFATGLRGLFPTLREAVALLIDPTRLSWLAFSHFEADECGALNEWLDLAPDARPLCGIGSATVNVDDWALRPARSLASEEVIATGRRRFRFLATPHLTHAWDTGMLFEETDRTLLCSDLFFQEGNPAPLTGDPVGPALAALRRPAPSPFAGMPVAAGSGGTLLKMLAALAPQTIAVAHGASFAGDGAQVIRQLHMELPSAPAW